ncbi:hypothetical protein acsn021_45150 [Anaerocolumna cellulosilytica]|uniref:Uncharacterized protein n=1 Tax=Anaerocolumna cellulosilytica TaxID=433286 RepID=A0A6S6R493_9FIRM|nr:DUF4446 family protein [Anaerocolumna cellulosilytica]MBB5195935.1 hypothetical protein [Anaerocolumna cellulosilytica]BCJ96946.1 hypothetical protein acsn021_45150 [Anaerocolumna cellulosilytica]
MDVIDSIGLDLGYIVIGLAGFSLFLFILVIILLIKHSKINKKYRSFMNGADGKSLETQFTVKFNELEDLKLESKRLKIKIDKVTENLLLTYQKVGIVKYDAFKEMGGKLSFALALLNDENNGFILNSMHSSREGCYTYIKEIIKGESFVVLAEEEKLALEEAKKTKNFME